MDLEQNFYLTDVYRFLFMVSRYKMLYRGATMHSRVRLCLVNAIFKCWEKNKCIMEYWILFSW